MSSDDPRWLDETEWAWAQAHLPVVCVDAVIAGHGTKIEQIGLILRDTPHQGRRWCLIGGRVLLGETLAEAVGRHVRASLGPSTSFVADGLEPITVAEYFPAVGATLRDPRKHAVAMTFVGRAAGPIDPRGEAIDFAWFPIKSFESWRGQMGFDQDHVLKKVMSLSGWV